VVRRRGELHRESGHGSDSEDGGLGHCHYISLTRDLLSSLLSFLMRIWLAGWLSRGS